MRNNEAGSVTVKCNSLPFGDIYIIDFGVIESCHQFGYMFTSQIITCCFEKAAKIPHVVVTVAIPEDIKIYVYKKLINPVFVTDKTIMYFYH